AELGLQHLDDTEGEEGGGEVAGAEDAERHHQPPELTRELEVGRPCRSAAASRVACEESEQREGEDRRDDGDGEHCAETLVGRQEDERRGGTDEGARRVERLVK